jgi:hypothetical protein
LAALLLSLPLAAQDLWFHLRVEGRDGRPSRVSINLPLQAVTRFLAAAPDDPCRGGCNAEFGGAELTMSDLRQVIGHLKAFPAGGVAVERDDIELRFRRDPAFLIATFDERFGKSGEMRMPFSLAEALTAGSNPSANLQAAAAQMATAGSGDVLLVGVDGASVRMWVDAQPEAGGDK